MKRKEDALLAAEFGANAIGLLVGQTHTSNDFISPEIAADIAASLPISCKSVLVTHLTDVQKIIELMDTIHPDMLQLHGESTVGEIKKIRDLFPSLYIIKAIHVIDSEAIKEAKNYAPIVDALLLDSINKTTDQVGGTGKTHNWSVSAQIVEKIDQNIILAGGLNPENIQEAIRTVGPFGVDVNSGTKGTDGFKSVEKMIAFIAQAKSA